MMTSRDDQRRRRQRTTDVRARIGAELRGLRVDAGLTLRLVARNAGVSPSHLSEIERGRAEASTTALVSVADVLGADLSIRAYPTTGPRVHDRFQAPIVEELIRISDPFWRSHPEVTVYRPARGSIDLVLDNRARPRLVTTEVYSELRRIERLMRWAHDKVASLPSSDLWQRLPVKPEVSSLLVVRSTARMLPWHPSLDLRVQRARVTVRRRGPFGS